MSDEIDISKLHGDIKLYAQKADSSKVGEKGYGKLDTLYELNLFKDMVKRNGKEADLLRQVPDVKGVTVPIKENDKDERTLNKKILSLMREMNTEINTKEMQDVVSEKLSVRRDQNQ